MAIENDSPEAQAPVADLKYLFFSSTEWLKSFSENQNKTNAYIRLVIKIQYEMIDKDQLSNLLGYDMKM